MRYGMTSAVLIVLAATPLAAQTAPVATTVEAHADPVDPASLAIADKVAAKLFPVGIYRKMMRGTMDMIGNSMGDTMKAIPMKTIAEMSGADAKTVQSIGKIDLEQVMAIYDPHWQERTTLTIRAMMDSMGGMMTSFEPQIRDALAHSYARRFSTTELADLDRYFSTPTGAKFAGQSALMFTDPEMMHEMQSLMPQIMKNMPDFMKTAQAATAKLPPIRKIEDLSPADRVRLAKLLGIKENQLHNPKTAP